MMSRAGKALEWPLALATVFLASGVIASQVAEAQVARWIELDTKSFSLSAEVEIVHEDGRENRYAAEEFHSRWQHRSRIDFQSLHRISDDLPYSEGSIFADSEQAFMADFHMGRCKRIDLKALDYAFNRDLVASFGSDHVIGTARMLSYLAVDSDKFKRATVLSSSDNGSLYEAKFGRDLVSVYYKEKDSSLAFGVPSVVNITRESEYKIIYSFLQVVPLEPYEFIYSESRVPSLRMPHAEEHLQFDMLALPRAFGCSEEDSSTGSRLKSVLSDTNHYRFSFKAKLMALGFDEPMEIFAGYEPDLETLRVDHMFSNSHSKILVSYRHDRAYHVNKRHSETSIVLDPNRRDSGPTGGPAENDLACIVSKVGLATKHTDICKNPHSLGKMLLGIDKATYLGLARVRGIQTRAFEAHHTQPPVWLEQPTIFQPVEAKMNATSKNYQWRWGLVPGDDDGNATLSSTTVFYFSRLGQSGSSQRDDLLDGGLVMIEIFRKTRTGLIKEKLRFDIYDFSWEHRAIAPDGSRMEDFYSLGDDCLARSREDNHYARLNMLLQCAPQGQREETSAALAVNFWFNRTSLRNTALSRAVHEQIGVPPTLMYDIESRYLKFGKENYGFIAGTMLLAERLEAPVRLLFLGRASLRTRIRPSPTHLLVLNFQVCYLIASHRRQDTLFVYDSWARRCSIFDGQLENEDEIVRKLLTPFGMLELYKAQHQSDRKLLHDDFITPLEDIGRRMTSVGRLVLTDPSQANTQEDPSDRDKIFFGIAHLDVNHFNAKTPFTLDELHLDDTNKFPGLGLVPEGYKTNKLLGPRRVSDGPTASHLEPVSFEQCHAACMSDFECRSFSVCIVDGEIQCVLSTIDFKASTLVLELMLLYERRSKLGESFTIMLDGGQLGTKSDGDKEAEPFDAETVKIKKHPTCELHNKNYKELFEETTQAQVSLRNKSLRPVTYAEQCAEMCFRQTLDSLRHEAARLRTKPNSVEEWSKVDVIDSNYCLGFQYLSEMQVRLENMTITAAMLASTNTEGVTNGYCILQDYESYKKWRHSGGSGQWQIESSQRPVKVHQYDLDLTVMYEARHNLSLDISSKSQAEQEAYKEIAFRHQFGPKHLDVMKRFIETGGNSGEKSMHKNPSECARACFTQSTPLWPGCRSFDFILIVNQVTMQRRSYCAFNSATLDDLVAAGRSDLIVRNGTQNRVKVTPDEQCEVWHYEPKQGLVAQSLEEVFQLEMDQTRSFLEQVELSRSGLHLSSFGLFFVVCISLVVGLTLGSKFDSLDNPTIGDFRGRASSVLRRAFSMATDSRDDDETLVPNRTHITFEEISATGLSPPTDINTEGPELM